MAIGRSVPSTPPNGSATIAGRLPLQLANMIRLYASLSIAQALDAGSADSKCRPFPLLWRDFAANGSPERPVGALVNSRDENLVKNPSATPAHNDHPAATPAHAWLRALETTAQATREPERILPRMMTEWARKYGEAPALVSDRERFSFRGLEARMNQYSRWALSMGVTNGETVALVMGNRPEYFAIWLGLIQVGAIVALVSPSLPRALASPMP